VVVFVGSLGSDAVGVVVRRNYVRVETCWWFRKVVNFRCFHDGAESGVASDARCRAHDSDVGRARLEVHGAALGLLIPFEDDGVGGGDAAGTVASGPEVFPRLGPVLRGKNSAWHVLAEKDAGVQLAGHIALVVLDCQLECWPARVLYRPREGHFTTSYLLIMS
jgi:hypothetical protein